MFRMTILLTLLAGASLVAAQTTESVDGTGMDSVDGTGLESVSGTGMDSVDGTGMDSVDGTGMDSVDGTGRESDDAAETRSVDGTGMHTVAEGETLGTLALQYYRDLSAWRRIYEANRDQLSDPNLIRPGMVLRIP